MKKWINPKTLLLMMTLLGIALCVTGLAMMISGNPRYHLFTAIGCICVGPIAVYNIIRSRKR